MSKIKLFLLGGIISLLSICSFTSADSFTLTNGRPWNNLSSVQGSFSIVGDSDSFFCQLSSKSSTLTYDGSYFHCGDYDFSSPSGVRFANGDFNVSCSSFPCSLSFSDGSFFEFLPPILSGGVSNFIPVITGVKDVAFQIIPFVIYVAIGLLVCSIGFVAIRWLLSWLWIKIKSIFSSKRD